MSDASLPEDLWQDLEPLLPPDATPGPKGGRSRVLNKTAMAGVYFVLCSGIPWQDLPKEFGCSGMTCWRRLRDWQLLSVWDQFHRLLLAALRKARKLDLSLASWTAPRRVQWGAVTRRGRTPQTAEKPAQSSICWSMPTGYHWKFALLGPTGTESKADRLR